MIELDTPRPNFLSQNIQKMIPYLRDLYNFQHLYNLIFEYKQANTACGPIIGHLKLLDCKIQN